jgi:hypothetical protein
MSEPSDVRFLTNAGPETNSAPLLDREVREAVAKLKACLGGNEVAYLPAVIDAARAQGRREGEAAAVARAVKWFDRAIEEAGEEVGPSAYVNWLRSGRDSVLLTRGSGPAETT